MAPMQGKTNLGDFKYFAGIDVRKAHLDLRVAGCGLRAARAGRGLTTMPWGSRVCWPV